jgi:hypothetical protein
VLKEIVLLVEPIGDSLNGRLRPHVLTGYVDRMILEKQGDVVRTWIFNGERALSGQRIFREELAPVKEEAETPVFDELKVKQPIQFGVDGQTFTKMVKRYGKK